MLYAFPRAEEDARDDAARASACRSRAASAAPSTATASSACCARRSGQEAERLPAGSDYVVVARPDARDLAEREGTGGVRTALAELVDGLGGAPA